MQCLEPQRVCNKDILTWCSQSFELVNRRLLANVSAVSLFFVILYFGSQAMVGVEQLASPVFVLMCFLIFSAFVFYLNIASLVSISYFSDHSEHISVNSIIRCFIPSQKMLLKLAILGVCVGIFFWYITLLMNPNNGVIATSENVFNNFASENLAVYYSLKTGAVFLFFVLLAKISLRTFFSLPLILFHGLSYEEAKDLSHKGILKNIPVMSNVLLLWTALILLAISVAPILVIFLLPLFAAFNYVTYRHIYLGEGLNEKLKNRQESMALS